MSLVLRQLITLDMLGQDLIDELACPLIQKTQQISSTYLSLLQQYLDGSLLLAKLATPLTDYEFTELIRNHGTCDHLHSKKLLLVQNKLLSYVIEYYQAKQKLDPIRETDFSEQAEVRFDLLTTKVIKSKSKYRTVAKAMAVKDYLNLIKAIGLAEFDWGWDKL